MVFNQSGWLVPVVFGLSLIVVMLFEPLGLAGRWSKVRLYFETWPFR
jgi:branched-chain amino acid transport system permease protein